MQNTVSAEQTQVSQGYKGVLPDIEEEFDYKTKNNKTANPPFSFNNIKNGAKLTPAPTNNPTFIDIIVKKDKTSKYVNDIAQIIPILNKLQLCIEEDKDIQKFNAIVSNLLDNIIYIETRYKEKPERYYISYRTLMDLSNLARNVAILRTESLVYVKYLPYSEQGAIYHPRNIQNQLDYLLAEVIKTTKVLKDVD